MTNAERIHPKADFWGSLIANINAALALSKITGTSLEPRRFDIWRSTELVTDASY